jgi:pimeloyl-ACP methyl ester carboxylesterase
MAWLRKLVGALLILSAIAVSLSREPDRAVETLVARWGLPPSSFVELGEDARGSERAPDPGPLAGQLVHLRDEGPRSDPVPIVLLHGTSASLHTWDGWAAELSKSRRVVRMDLPGFGLTGPRADGRYGLDDDARFVLAVLDHLKLGRVVIGGNSLGGRIAWRVATLAPQRVERLLLVDAAGLPDSLGSIPLGWRIARTPGLGKTVEWMLPRPMVVQGLVAVYGDPARIDDALVDRYFELTLREGNRAALRQRLVQYVPGEHAATIAGIRQPTLILWGGRDTVIPPAAAAGFERLIPGSRRVMFDALGHVPHEEDPAATLVPVKVFLGID